ncbi:hypothetical protein ACHQM5_027288 [Ranunculus cassubicifolius]
MSFKRMCLVLLFVLVLLLTSSIQPYEATSRSLLSKEQGWLVIDKLHLQAVKRGSVPSSGSSGCTNIPGLPGPNCPPIPN